MSRSTIMFQPKSVADSITAATQIVLICSGLGCAMPPVLSIGYCGVKIDDVGCGMNQVKLCEALTVGAGMEGAALTVAEALGSAPVDGPPMDDDKGSVTEVMLPVVRMVLVSVTTTVVNGDCCTFAIVGRSANDGLAAYVNASDGGREAEATKAGGVTFGRVNMTV